MKYRLDLQLTTKNYTEVISSLGHQFRRILCIKTISLREIFRNSFALLYICSCFAISPKLLRMDPDGIIL